MLRPNNMLTKLAIEFFRDWVHSAARRLIFGK
jgi:hypothetical protein